MHSVFGNLRIMIFFLVKMYNFEEVIHMVSKHWLPVTDSSATHMYSICTNSQSIKSNIISKPNGIFQFVFYFVSNSIQTYSSKQYTFAFSVWCWVFSSIMIYWHAWIKMKNVQWCTLPKNSDLIVGQTLNKFDFVMF